MGREQKKTLSGSEPLNINSFNGSGMKALH